jgi:hypothetical protein
MSTRSVFLSAAARLAARLIAVVVFPTPPFWFEMQIVRDTVLPPIVPFARLRALKSGKNGLLCGG